MRYHNLRLMPTALSFLGTCAFLLVLASCKKRSFGAQVKSWNESPLIWSDPEEPPFKPMFVVDAAGTNGRSGGSGSSGSSGFSGYSGGNGSDGSDGGDGTPGGSIDVSLKYGSNAGEFILEGSAKGGKGGGQTVAHRNSTQADGFLWLKANGGQGGSGGEGGDGGRGGDGSRGSDATQSSSGSSGGPGGSGGRGGDGGNGGDGGAGGRIQIKVPEDQTELLWLVRQESFPGPSGRAGSEGSGGSGGSGGPGGSSYSWSEPDGNGGSNSRSNSGGSYGFSGSSGSSGNSGRKGREGGAGSAKIVVVRANGTTATFDRMFELAIEGVGFHEKFADGIFEPGEKISLAKLNLSNSGDMPTPQKNTVFALDVRGDISKPSQPLEFPEVRGLAAKEKKSYEFPAGKYEFVVKEQAQTRGSVLFTPSVKIGGMTKVLRQTNEYPLLYPVMYDLESVGGVKLVVQGQVSNHSIKVQNMSKTASYGDSGQIRRKSKIRLSYAGGDVPLGAFDIAVNGNVSDFASGKSVEVDVPTLSAGTSYDLNFEVRINETQNIKAHLKLKAEVLIAPTEGAEPSVVADEQEVDLMHSLDPSWEFDLNADLSNKFLKCNYTNPKRSRYMGRLIVQKQKGTLEMYARFINSCRVFTFGAVRSGHAPNFKVDLNDSAEFLNNLNKNTVFDDESLPKFFNEIMKNAKDVPEAWRFEGCEIDVKRRDTPWWAYAGPC